MPTLRFLCLHGAGTNAEIMRAQLEPLAKWLQNDNTATFDFIQGQLPASAGPGVEPYYPGPYYTFYAWPPTSSEADDESIQEAYEDLYETLEEEGPFDGLLGFSHGGTLLAGFLAHHAATHPFSESLVRCAVFISSLPPFRMDGEGQPRYDYGDQQALIQIPTVHVVGKKDFVYAHSMKLFDMCDQQSSALVTHDQGHKIPGEGKVVDAIAKAVKDLAPQVMAF